LEYIELRDKLNTLLSNIYNMQSAARLSEFWQGELRVLLYIYLHSDGDSNINPSELSNVIHVSRARITTTLTSLRKKKYVTMEMCEDDRRKMRVFLTSYGKNYIEERKSEVDEQLDAVINGLGENDILEFLKLLDTIIKIMDN